MDDLHSFKDYLGLNKARIYNLEHRKKPAELVRKDLISAMKLPDHETLNKEHFLRILDPWREEWEKGVQVPVNPDSLPQLEIKSLDNLHVSPEKTFKNIIPNSFNLCDNLPQNQYRLPKNLIKYENQFENSSAYELDLQDICWLEAVNASDLNVKIPENLMEDVINELEQQCIHNIKEHHIGIEYDDHIVCDVCQNPDAEDGNEMVFCELCNICVHQACYGIPEIPIGDWFCNSCRDLGSKKNVVCALCPNIGGALKPTTKANQWAHVSCAFWIPEVIFEDLPSLEPINIKKVSNFRWNLVCSLCNVKKGAPITCEEKNCRTSYHVTCAFKHKLQMKIVTENKSNVQLKSYCNRHSPDSTESVAQFNSEDYISRNVNETEKSKNINPQHEFWKYVDINKLYQTIVDKYNDDNIENPNAFIKDCILSPKLFHQIIDLVHQYWKLKRISNYGNSLIKLTFAQKFEEEMQFHQNKLVEFRFHLERLRTLSYMLCRREKIKEKWVVTQKEIFENSCKLFGVSPVDQSTDLPSNSQSCQNKELFKQIMSVHNIYNNQNEIPEQKIATQTFNELDAAPLKRRASLMLNDHADLINSTLNVIRTQKNLELEQHKELSEKLTNLITRQLKRLPRTDHLSTPKANPYAKFYVNSGNKRKTNGFESEYQFDHEDSYSIKENGQLLDSSINDKTDSLKTPIAPKSKTSNKIIYSNAKRKLNMSLEEGESLLDTSNNFSNLSSHQSPKKILKFDLVTKTKPQVNSPSKEFTTKRTYNFRSGSSNDRISLNHIQEIDKKLVCNESHLKENGHYVNHSPRIEGSFEIADSLERVTRPNRRDLSKFEQTNNVDKSITTSDQVIENRIMIGKNTDRQLINQRKSLNRNNENFKSDINCLTVERNRYRKFNSYSNRRINSN